MLISMLMLIMSENVQKEDHLAPHDEINKLNDLNIKALTNLFSVY